MGKLRVRFCFVLKNRDRPVFACWGLIDGCVTRELLVVTCQQEKLIRRLDQEFLACARRYGLPLGDFPKVRPAVA